VQNTITSQLIENDPIMVGFPNVHLI